MAATPSQEMRERRLDFDGFDAFCDHLLVIDLEKSNGEPKVVGTYRLLRQEVAEAHGGFYSQDEFDLEPLLARQRHLRFLEILPMAAGPQAGLLMVDQDKFAPWLAEKVGFNPTLLRPKADRDRLVEQMAQLAATQGGAMVGQ